MRIKERKQSPNTDLESFLLAAENYAENAKRVQDGIDSLKERLGPPPSRPRFEWYADDKKITATLPNDLSSVSLRIERNHGTKSRPDWYSNGEVSIPLNCVRIVIEVLSYFKTDEEEKK